MFQYISNYTPTLRQSFKDAIQLRPYSVGSNSSSKISKAAKLAATPILKKTGKKPLSAIALLTISALILITFRDYQQTLTLDHNDPIRPTSWPLFIYSYLPLNAMSRLWGSFNSLDLPTPLRAPCYRFYSFLFGVNIDEMKNKDLSNYPNLGKFFYREIDMKHRPIDPNALLVSPADGKVLKFGKVDKDGNIEQVKGMTYHLETFLGSTDSKKIANSNIIAPNLNSKPIENQESHSVFLNHLLNNTNLDCSSHAQDFAAPSEETTLVEFTDEGERALFHPTTAQVIKASIALNNKDLKNKEETDLFYTVIYLAPGDYHRFHSPVTWVTTLRRHFVGQLYSVAPYFQNTFNNLFVLNERVSLLGYWKYGFFSMTPVGATNVGSIKLNFDEDLVTNTKIHNGVKSKKNTCYEAHYTNSSPLLKGQPLFKGQEMGGFMLGSTVVLVFEAPKSFKFTLTQNQHIKVGETIGELNTNQNL